MTNSLPPILIIGVGSIGERHLRCFLQTGRVRVSICEANAELRQAITARYDVESAYGDLVAALAHPFQAAVIATPAASHLPIALKAAQRGIHLLIEKPLSTSSDLIDLLAATAESHQLTIAVAYVMRNHPALIAAREAILSGEFGHLLQAVVVSGQNFPFYRPAYRDTYYARRSSGGGAIQDALTHFVNAVKWIAGPVDRVMADAAHLSLPGVEVEDTVHVVARHGSVLATYSLNQYQAPNESTLTFVCERGVVRVALHSNQWSSVRATNEPWTEHTLPELQRDDLFIRQANGFLDAVAGRSPVACNLDEGAATLFANLAILQAADAPSWLEVSSAMTQQ